MFSLISLQKFLNKADKPHADGTATIIREDDGSNSIRFRDGTWSMHDSFFGGEPYGGRQIVYYNKRPVWFCAYYGRVEDRVAVKPVYDFLRRSLQQAPVNGFSRGPAKFSEGEFTYHNNAEGSLENFSGHESIDQSGHEVYSADYMGGLVDQHARGEY